MKKFFFFLFLTGCFLTGCTDKDDDIVPYTESEKYHKQIPGSSLHIFEDRGHFLGEEFSELFENIKKVSS